MNMSYVRYENTLKDVVDCVEALENREETSEREATKAFQLIIEVLDFAENEGIIEDFDENVLDEITYEIT